MWLNRTAVNRSIYPIFTLIILSLPTFALADTTVLSPDPGGDDTAQIRSAVQNAANGDILFFNAGTYTVKEEIVASNPQLSLIGVSRDAVTIQATGTATTPFQMRTSTEAANLGIDGISQNGFSDTASLFTFAISDTDPNGSADPKEKRIDLTVKGITFQLSGPIESKLATDTTTTAHFDGVEGNLFAFFSFTEPKEVFADSWVEKTDPNDPSTWSWKSGSNPFNATDRDNNVTGLLEKYAQLHRIDVTFENVNIFGQNQTTGGNALYSTYSAQGSMFKPSVGRHNYLFNNFTDLEVYAMGTNHNGCWGYSTADSWLMPQNGSPSNIVYIGNTMTVNTSTASHGSGTSLDSFGLIHSRHSTCEVKMVDNSFIFLDKKWNFLYENSKNDYELSSLYQGPASLSSTTIHNNNIQGGPRLSENMPTTTVRSQACGNFGLDLNITQNQFTVDDNTMNVIELANAVSPNVKDNTIVGTASTAIALGNVTSGNIKDNDISGLTTTTAGIACTSLFRAPNTTTNTTIHTKTGTQITSCQDDPSNSIHYGN